MSRRGSYELPIRGEVRGKPLLRAPRVEKVCHGISAGNCNERHSRQSMEDSSDEVYKMRFTADLFAKTFHYPPAMVSLAIECGLESEWKMLATEIWVLRCFLPQRHGAAEPQPNAEFPRRSRSCGTEGGKEGIFWTGCTGLTGWEGARFPTGCGEFNAEAEELKMRGARKLSRFAMRRRGVFSFHSEILHVTAPPGEYVFLIVTH